MCVGFDWNKEDTNSWKFVEPGLHIFRLFIYSLIKTIHFITADWLASYSSSIHWCFLVCLVFLKKFFFTLINFKMKKTTKESKVPWTLNLGIYFGEVVL